MKCAHTSEDGSTCRDKQAIDALAKKIAATVDRFNAKTPISVMHTLAAVEKVRHTLTEAYLTLSK